MPMMPMIADGPWTKSKKGNLFLVRGDGTVITIFRRKDGRFGISTKSEEWGFRIAPERFIWLADAKRLIEEWML